MEFALPMLPGSGAFYDWVTAQPKYYPGSRWEFAEVRQLVATAARPVSLLDVGCGSGDFLISLKGLSNVDAAGLDTTPNSVDTCHERGVSAVCLGIHDYSARYPDKKYDFVVSFHCIEHVADPAAFVRDLATLLKPNGKLIITAPLSPMYFETSWFDPLNHPPHHLSRFTVQSLQALASNAKLSASVRTSPSPRLARRALNTVRLKFEGPTGSLRTVKLLAYAPMLALELVKQIRFSVERSNYQGNTFIATFTSE